MNRISSKSNFKQKKGHKSPRELNYMHLLKNSIGKCRDKKITDWWKWKRKSLIHELCSDTILNLAQLKRMQLKRDREAIAFNLWKMNIQEEFRENENSQFYSLSNVAYI